MSTLLKIALIILGFLTIMSGINAWGFFGIFYPNNTIQENVPVATSYAITSANELGIQDAYVQTLNPYRGYITIYTPYTYPTYNNYEYTDTIPYNTSYNSYDDSEYKYTEQPIQYIKTTYNTNYYINGVKQ